MLPKNPTSIVAKASLLVDSKLLEMIPEGAKWDSDEWLRKVVFEWQVFSLGWCRGRDGERRYGIDVRFLIGMKLRRCRLRKWARRRDWVTDHIVRRASIWR